MVFVRNKDFEIVAIIDDYLSLIWTNRMNSPGDAQLVIKETSKYADYLVLDNYLELEETVNLESHDLMIIESVKHPEGEPTIEIVARSFESVLSRRLIVGSYEFNTDATGEKRSLVSCLKELFDGEFHNDTLLSRNLPQFVFKDPEEMSNINDIEMPYVKTSHENLGDFIASLCNEYSLGYQFHFVKPEKIFEEYNLESEYKLVFELFLGVDRTSMQDVYSPVIFDKNLGTITSDALYIDATQYKNSLLYQVSDDDNLNTMFQSEEATGIYIRDTLIQYDESMTEEQSKELIQKELKNNKIIFSGDGSIRTTQYTYGLDFEIADIVQVNLQGVAFSAQVTEMIYSNDGSEEAYYPTFNIIGQLVEKEAKRKLVTPRAIYVGTTFDPYKYRIYGQDGEEQYYYIYVDDVLKDIINIESPNDLVGATWKFKNDISVEQWPSDTFTLQNGDLSYTINFTWSEYDTETGRYKEPRNISVTVPASDSWIQKRDNASLGLGIGFISNFSGESKLYVLQYSATYITTTETIMKWKLFEAYTYVLNGIIENLEITIETIDDAQLDVAYQYRAFMSSIGSFIGNSVYVNLSDYTDRPRSLRNAYAIAAAPTLYNSDPAMFPDMKRWEYPVKIGSILKITQAKEITKEEEVLKLG